jgi:hypothetical protein
MELFEEVFNAKGIYDMLFFNIKAVLEYPTLDELKTKNPVLYERWKYISKTKYDRTFDENVLMTDAGYRISLQGAYEEKAIYHPEFSRIVAITYASLYLENGQIKRYFKKIANEDESMTIATFMDVLYQLSSEGVKSNPPYFPVFCGHNIMSYDIPLLIKRFLKNKDKIKEILKVNENITLPYIIKKCLAAKPWDSAVIDTVNVWKFNGNDYTPLMLITDFLKLKKTVDLEALQDVSKHYWSIVADKPQEALEYVALQSATQTNLVIQLMNELRQL